MLFLPVFSIAQAIEATGPGKITVIRILSVYHQYVPENQTEIIFKISFSHAGCDWLGVNNKDQAFVSMILSAEAQDKEIKVWYYSELKSPIWETVCQASPIELR